MRATGRCALRPRSLAPDCESERMRALQLAPGLVVAIAASPHALAEPEADEPRDAQATEAEAPQGSDAVAAEAPAPPEDSSSGGPDPAGANPPEASAQASDSTAAQAGDDEVAGDHEPSEPAESAAADSVSVPSAEPVPVPPPAAPRPEDQPPRPYLKAPGPDPPSRQVTLGPVFGLWLRPAKGDGPVSYSTSLAWGVHARVELLRWLGVRGLVVATRHPVSVEPGGLGPAGDTAVEQPALGITLKNRLHLGCCTRERISPPKYSKPC